MYKKICKHHGELILENIQVEKNIGSKLGYTLRCRLCRLEKQFNYRDKRREELCEKNKIYKKNNREKVNEWNRKDRKKKPELYSAAKKRHMEKLGQDYNIREISRRLRITPEKFKELYDNQGNKCAICHKEETRKSRSGKTNSLCLDHNHTTGEIREFLCHNCNVVIGHSKESIEILEKAIEYLKKHTCK